MEWYIYSGAKRLHIINNNQSICEPGKKIFGAVYPEQFVNKHSIKPMERCLKCKAIQATSDKKLTKTIKKYSQLHHVAATHI